MRVAVAVAADRADLAAARAVAALGRGYQERTRPDGRAELVFWADPAERDRVVSLLGGLRDLDAGLTVDVSDQDPGWHDAMRAFHTPIEVGGVLRVRPPWVPADPGLLDVVIDPGMAFGTGQHTTTRSCLELLLGVPPAPAVDVGCGSGVLAIAARRLGFGPVWALDNDPLAVEATLANARANGVALTVGRRAMGVDRLPHAPVLLANLTGDLLRRLAAAVAADPPRRAVLSGIRPAEVDATLAAWAPLGLRLTERRGDSEWTALALEAR